MEELQQQLDQFIGRLDDPEALRVQLNNLVSIYPFNNFEYIISHLLATSKMTLEDYLALREAYIKRNVHLDLFEISAPRNFGESWAQGYVRELVPTAQKPDKKLDANYSGQYDLLVAPDIRIEVKASRAVDADSSEPLYIKALSSDSAKPFEMNFQQIKPEHCDVLVFIAVWRDVIRFWVLPSITVETNSYYSKGQHRGNVGEGQLHFNQNNIGEFDTYRVEPSDLEEAITAAAGENRRLRQQPSGDATV